MGTEVCMPFIFQNSSYVLGYRLEEEVFRGIADSFSAKSIRSLNCSETSELGDCLRKVRFLTALFVNPDCTPQEIGEIRAILDERSLKNVQLIALGANPPAESIEYLASPSEHLEADLEALLVRMVPARIEELMLNSLHALLPSYMPDSGMTFTYSAHRNEDLDYQVMTVCHVAAEPFVGQGVQYVHLGKLAEFYPPMAGKNEVQQRDFAREFLNQFLGILNRSLLKLGLITSIGVPEQHDKERVASIRRTGPYLPMMQIMDDKGVFVFELGFVHREGSESMDLSQLNFESEEEDEIDFF
jgi:hypothetical protein